MKTLKRLFYFSFIISLSLCMSCEGEDGMDGLNGEQGIQGEPGQDGEDGNANVTGVTVDPFPSWTSGSYLGQEANFVEITEPLLTEAVADDALVLVYFQLFSSNIWYPMTYAFPFDNGNEEVITYTYEPDLITVYALSTTGPLNASISKVRYFIISSNDASSRSATSVETKMQNLQDKGIDIYSYEEVANYFNQR
ncbi:hypothetical protein [Aquimarina litoralis]|uniref:hypothetical protein n=1 Tax=Aquimarina litoralis TaxID=584605 RepID=UPI001C56282D|nr:hypothetical protein [Aquimarina litoralis]MBW1295007.1 hypothetical protein [Aquimarina litoralis]